MASNRNPHHCGVAVVLEGDAPEVEAPAADERIPVEIHPGQTREEPSSRAHRTINIGQKRYQQINIFLLNRTIGIPQSREEYD